MPPPITDPTSLNAILPKLMLLEAFHGDPRHDGDEFYRIQLEGTCEQVDEWMKQYPHMVPCLRQSLAEHLEDGWHDSQKSSSCSKSNYVNFVCQINELGEDSDGALEREAQAMLLAQARSEQLSQPVTGGRRAMRHRS